MTASHSLPYSTRTRVVLAIARAIAAGRGDDDLTPVHIALGLLREGENAAIAVFQHQGVPLSIVRSELEDELGLPPGGTRPDEVVLPLTPGELRIVTQARDWSGREGDEYIGAQHLLLAISADDTSRAAQVLARHGINTETVRASLRVVIHKHGGAVAPHA